MTRPQRNIYQRFLEGVQRFLNALVIRRTSEGFDGVSFSRRVTNLVIIDNAIRPSQPTSSSQANVVNSSSQANVASSSSQANVANGSSQEDQIDPQALKKALEECRKEIKISTEQIAKLDSSFSTLLLFTYQILGFFLVFQGAMIAVTFNQTSIFDVEAFSGIITLSVLMGLICIIAILNNAARAQYQKWRRDKEEFRLQMYERYKRQLLFYGVEFKFLKHKEIINPYSATCCNLFFNASYHVTLHLGIVLFMGFALFITVRSEDRVFRLRHSTLADSGAPAPAPGVVPVQSGKTWCVAKAGSPDIDVMNGLNFACGEGGADCGPIQAGGACFSPDTIVSHASFAYNTYYQNTGRNPWNCSFGGTSVITITDPSYSGCRFL